MNIFHSLRRPCFPKIESRRSEASLGVGVGAAFGAVSEGCDFACGVSVSTSVGVFSLGAGFALGVGFSAIFGADGVALVGILGRATLFAGAASTGATLADFSAAASA